LRHGIAIGQGGETHQGISTPCPNFGYVVYAQVIENLAWTASQQSPQPQNSTVEEAIAALLHDDWQAVAVADLHHP